MVALVARHYLRPEVLARVDAMLASDAGNDLTAHDMAAEATWADKARDADLEGAKLGTRQWHFVDIELSDGDADHACFGHPPLRPGAAAFPGQPDDCVVDKVDQFRAELADRRADPAERLLALKFLLHFVGDLHQPLHSSDDDDRGGNEKHVADADPHSRNLHGYWDTSSVGRLGPDARTIAASLVAAVTPAQQSAWETGSTMAWAIEAFGIAKADAYGRLPPPDPSGGYGLTASYDVMAARDAALQLSQGGREVGPGLGWGAFWRQLKRGPAGPGQAVARWCRCLGRGHPARRAGRRDPPTPPRRTAAGSCCASRRRRSNMLRSAGAVVPISLGIRSSLRSSRRRAIKLP